MEPQTFQHKNLLKSIPSHLTRGTKLLLTDLARIFCSLYDIDIICLRYFNVFGPGQYGDSPYSTAVSAWCNSIKNSLPMRSDGDGTQSRDLCYVDNVVHANILAAESDQSRYDGFNGSCYNIACGDRTTNNEILDFFKEKYSHAVVVNAPWRQGDVMHTQADIDRAKEDFGYEPRVRFWEGLERTFSLVGYRIETMKEKKHAKSSWIARSRNGINKYDKPWGYEIQWVGFNGIHGKILFIKKGHRTSFKKHKMKNEVLFLKSGEATITLGDEFSIFDPTGHPVKIENMKSGDSLLVQSECPYRIKADTDCELIEIGNYMSDKPSQDRGRLRKS